MRPVLLIGVSLSTIILILLLCVNSSFSTRITDCLCSNDILPKIILICDNRTATKKVDARYYPCYREIFTEDAARSEFFLRTGDFCRGSTLDARIPDAFNALTHYIISHHGVERLSPDDLRFNRLRELDASHNKLTAIQAGLFKYAPQLYNIELDFNNISAVEAGAFLELPELKLLLLRNNPLRHFDGRSFLPIHYRCDLFDITWENVDVFNITNMDGVYEFEFNDSESQANRALAFGNEERKSDSYTRNYKQYTNDNLNHLKVFAAHGTPIRGVVKLIGILGPSIEWLDVSSSFIGHLNANIFSRFSELMILNLSHTNLTSIDATNFFGFNKLKTFNASHNALTSIPAGLFQYTPDLVHIDLSFNNITALNAADFSRVNGRARIHLNNNPLRRIDGKAFLPIHLRMDAVDITWDNVEEFDISHLAGMYDFSFKDDGFAYGTSVLIDQVTHKSQYLSKSFRAKQFRNLKVFNASGSDVKDMMKVIALFGPSIEVLDLSENSIEQLDHDVLNRFMNLKYLILKRTNLSSFDFDDFRNRAQLKVLDVSHNNLPRIHFTPTYGSFEQLQKLNVIGNKLEEIDFVAPWNFPTLTSVGISENNFTCAYLQEFQRRWPDLEWYHKDTSLFILVNGIGCHY